jgi:3-hydroxyisobutyrate dehydrogenase-like beta-hydroxyacid dehydrogenase
MQTIGFVGLGKIGLPIAENLIKSGYRVLGYRRSAMADFENIGGIPARSPADVAAQADIVFSCLPSSEALQEVVQGRDGFAAAARPGQIFVELGSHPVSVKEQQIAPLAQQGAFFLDGEVSGTPGMVSARKAVIYLGGDAAACKKVEPLVAGFADSCITFGPFGAASKVKLVNNLLVAVHIAAAAEAMALGLKAGVDVDLMIKAVATGSGGSTQFGIRAPWMAQRRFFPAQGTVPALAHYFDLIGEFADREGVATPMLDRAKELYQVFMEKGLGEHDVAAMVDVIASLPRHKD